MHELQQEEKGLAVVEATLLLPFCIIMVFAIFYAAIFLCQRANLQANLETTLVYYKNVSSDTYVTAETQMKYTNVAGTVGAVGSSFEEPTLKFPYRFITLKFSEENFKNFFTTVCGTMFFDDGDNIEVTTETKNYVVYKEISATATQTVRSPINLSMVGGENEMTLMATGKVIVNDADDLIRNVDFVIDIVEDTKMGQWASDIAGKVSEYYNKFKDKFKVK